MKNILRPVTLLVLMCAAGARAGATAPTSWIDVVGTYGADPTCTTDSGPAINSAIAAATAPGAVLFFQTGCYLIKTEIVDINTASEITYLGYGNVTLQAAASASLPAILQLGDSTHTVTGRRISNLVFQCASSPSASAPSATDGIDAPNLQYSVFKDVQILNFGGYGLQTSGRLGYAGSAFKGGVINTQFATGTGVSLTQNGWTLLGTTLTGSSNPVSGASGGAGIELLGGQFACIDCNVSNWKFGVTAGLGVTVNGLEISGGSYTNNAAAEIRIGSPGPADGLGNPSWRANGVSIHGATIVGLSASYCTTPFCIDLEAASGFSIVGNTFTCPLDTVRALADDNTPNQVAGADIGVVGPNNDDTNSSGYYRLQGRDIAFYGPACSSASSPANCRVASAGAVAIPGGAFSLTVNDPFVAASSRIVIGEDMTLGSQLAVTCNGAGGRTYSITNKTPGVSFTVTASSAPVGNPACLTFHIEN